MRKLLAPLLLSIVVLLAFWPALDNGFVYDDEPYVTDNPHVQSGLTLASVAWAWTTEHAANWHPITWMSHMLDFELFGENPRGHHATSLILHLANTLLLYFWIQRMSGARAKSWLVAALFAVHPLRVESVAWVAERKDVLSTLFWLLAMIAYVAHVKAGKASIPWLSTVLLGVGLTAKPMLVTLPFTLLLLDWWPLGRTDLGWRRLIREKLPMFALAAASCVVTLWSQHSGKALIRLEQLPVQARVSNAIVSLLRYMGKTLWPRDLAVFYPHPQRSLSIAVLAVSTLALIAITTFTFRARRRRPYLLFGWLWYVGTLIPVLGLVQVGSQAMADRYSYVPLIGIFVIAVWAAVDACRPCALAGFGAVLLVLIPVTRAQVRTWHDPVTLFTHAIAAAGPSALMETNLADALDEAGRVDDAVEHYQRASRLDPSYPEAHNNLGVLFYRTGRLDDAIAEYTLAVRHDGGTVEMQENLARALAAKGDALSKLGRVDEAVHHYEQVLRIRPDLPDVWNNLGVAQTGQGRLDDALASLDRALALRPDYATAHANRAAALYAMKKYAQAREEVRLARAGGVEPPARLIELLSAAGP